jgi:hypothetical protein
MGPAPAFFRDASQFKGHPFRVIDILSQSGIRPMKTGNGESFDHIWHPCNRCLLDHVRFFPALLQMGEHETPNLNKMSE